jgi:TetR/AcrR family transcriptional repressor of nem operon
MARPREFDEASVLDAALAVFWSKGFDGASIEDLVEATGLGRASLYGAFGDKRALFERVLDHYATAASAGDAVPEGASPNEALRTLTARWVKLACAPDHPRGCFLQQSCIVDASAPMARDLTTRAARTRRKLLERIIADGQRTGAFASGTSPHDLAGFLLTVQQGIAASARIGASQRELEAVMEVALGRVTGT